MTPFKNKALMPATITPAQAMAGKWGDLTFKPVLNVLPGDTLHLSAGTGETITLTVIPDTDAYAQLMTEKLSLHTDQTIEDYVMSHVIDDDDDDDDTAATHWVEDVPGGQSGQYLEEGILPKAKVSTPVPQAPPAGKQQVGATQPPDRGKDPYARFLGEEDGV